MEDRVCPECRSEFQPTVEFCLDCGGVTVPASQVEAASTEPGRRQGLESAEEAVIVRACDYDWASHLLEKLQSHQIASNLVNEPGCCPPRYVVIVGPEDAERAKEIDSELFRERVPDAAQGLAEDADEEICPACGTQVAATATECGECGLGLALPEIQVE